MATIEVTNSVASGGGRAGLGPFASPGVPASGFLNGIAEKGAVVTDTTNGIQYTNTGTKASTVYTKTGLQT